MRGARKLLFGFVGLLFVACGFGACASWPALIPALPPYLTAVVAIVSAVILGNVGTHWTQRGGGTP